MKCISLWQPWASLIAVGAKTFETRHWPTMISGRIAIHAAKKWDGELRELCNEKPFLRLLIAAGADPVERLPRGAIVCTCELTDCFKIGMNDMRSILRPAAEPAPLPDSPERDFGNYAPDRYAWRLERIIPLETPIPFSGHQGFFDVPDELFTSLPTARVDQMAPTLW